MNGLINLNKPSGMSSAQAVSRVKRILGEKRVGHMGTLDPMAEGVLVIGVGKCTRLFDYFCGERKEYIATFKFGEETNTLDALGKVINTTKDIPSDEAVLHAMQSLVGEIEQVPPQYSAKHVNGQRAYALARAGKQVELKPVKVTIYDVQLLLVGSDNTMVFSISCSAGTYIRSICRDVAKMCGSLATLTHLDRTRTGCFCYTDSIKLETLERDKQNALIPPQWVLDLPKYVVKDELYDDMIHGRKIPCAVDRDSMIYCKGELFGIGKAVNGILKIKTYLHDND